MMVYIICLSLLIHRAWLVSVQTPDGTIVGQVASDGNYAAFFGVPYALVDIRNPFANTLEYPSFKTPFHASNPSIKCPQLGTNPGGNLQCLILNIHVPTNVNTSGLAVLVWFHGGGFTFGSAGEYKPTPMLQHGIIVVTVNYRLGPYGFLCTSDIKNQGLKDMKTALKWIKRNIKAFGGNPNKVTIAGESWGGSAVDFLLYEGGDFNQAIIQSGTRFSYGVSTRKDNEAVIQLAVLSGYNATNYKDALKILIKANPIQVMLGYSAMDYIFGICEEAGDFELNFDAEYADRIKNTPILIGNSNKETFGYVASQPDSYYNIIDYYYYNTLGNVFNLNNDALENLANIVWDFYLGDKMISPKSMLEIIDLSSDFEENYGTERSVTNYMKLGNTDVYKYVFSFVGESPYKNWVGAGAYHTEELLYLFDWGTTLTTPEEYKMRSLITTMWASFVKFGVPTSSQQFVWNPTNSNKRSYLNITHPKPRMENYVNHKRMAFWELIWATYGKHRT